MPLRLLQSHLFNDWKGKYSLTSLKCSGCCRLSSCQGKERVASACDAVVSAEKALTVWDSADPCDALVGAERRQPLGMLLKEKRQTATSACDVAVTIKINPASEPCSDADGNSERIFYMVGMCRTKVLHIANTKEAYWAIVQQAYITTMMSAHEIRKGSATHVLCVTTCPPPISSIANRGNWSIIKVLDMLYW